MSINQSSSIGAPRSIPSSNHPVRQARPPAAQNGQPQTQSVILSREAKESVNQPAKNFNLKLFGESHIPKSLSLSKSAQDMSVNTYKFLQRMYPKLDAEKALLQGLRDLCPTSHEHCERVGDLAFRLARELDLTDEEFEELEEELEDSAELKESGFLALTISAMDDAEIEQFFDEAEKAGEFHDIGKLAIPDDILNKPSSLTEEEYEIVKLHPLVGETMLTPLDLPESVLAAVRGHHEHWDGSGYPDGLKGTEIPMTARILTVVDSFDAMTAGRPYRDTLTSQQAVEEILANAGTQFDPFIAEMFATMVTQVEKEPIE
jgi:HD-GYP domain-containing protein (c-di-GMP phosphodiesterase class II)